MKVEYLKGGPDDCPLIRLYDFRVSEIKNLKQAFDDLANGAIQKLSLQDLMPIQFVDKLQLIFACDVQDKGVVLTELNNYEVLLTPLIWKQIAELTEPFCKGNTGFQWLYQAGRIKLLLSTNGKW